jgi:predicted nuclease of predicted toxin-antitoxin system
MKLLLDTCISGAAAEPLRSTGHDVVWAGEWPRDPGDDEILARAHAEHRVLVTLDKDFGELAVVFGHPHSGIVRIANFRAAQQAAVIEHLIANYSADLASGAIITAEPGRVRIRAPGASSEGS